MKIKPTILTAPNAIGLDAVIAEIITALQPITYDTSGQSGLSYFSEGLILPLARLDEQTGKPIVYWKGKDYFPANPNDNFRSVTFFYQEDSNNAVSLNSSTYNINIVHWYNQDKFLRHANYSIKELVIAAFKKQILKYLRTENMSTLQIYRETDQVFSKYSLGDKTLMKHPYDAFRMQFAVTTDNDCEDVLIKIT